MQRNLLPGVPLVESPFFEQLLQQSGYDAETQQIARALHANGFAVINFPDAEIDAVAERIKHALAPEFDLRRWQDEWHGAGVSLRARDAWLTNVDVRRIACNKYVTDLLGKLYGRAAWPFQTLNFPVGTQQHFHTDSVHFSSAPERFMCGVWLALEDVDADNGPLVYYPGSHRWPIYTNEHLRLCAARMDGMPSQALYEEMWRALVEQSGIAPVHFHARKGQALIWAANLMHGGSVQRDKLRTRWSQVTHYFFDDCAYYTPMLSDPFYGKIAFRRLHDIRTARPVPQQYAGHLIPQEFTEASIPAMFRVDDGFDPALYLQANPDVAAAGVNPLEHYLAHGRKEGRRLRP
ncbi:MAG TPA: phytanoyl-CoA dioxygenase family protein [Telluria sp.]|nr:phytanoyl-CoA dioxygenase family protein [Telluria sp.]